MLDITKNVPVATKSRNTKQTSCYHRKLKNSGIIEILDDDTILARYIPTEDIEKPGLNFYSNDKEFIQFGVWGYNKGKVLPVHAHNLVERSTSRTQEALIVQRGKIKAFIYNLKEIQVTELLINQGEAIILLNGAHGYEILEDNTQVLEFKNGPYVGAELDRKRL